MRPTLREVFDGLVSEGRLAPEDERRLHEALLRHGSETPWFVKVLIGAGAWVATLLFIVFLVLLDLYDEGGVLLGLGAVLAGAAVALRRAGSTAIAVQLALAMSLVGQVMIFFGAIELGAGPLMAAGTLLVLCLAMLIAFPDGVHRFLCTLACVASALFILYDLDEDVLPHLGFAILTAATVVHWLAPARLAGLQGELRGPVGHGLSVALLLLIVPDSLGVRDALHAVVGSAVLTVALLAVEVSLLRRVRGALDRPALALLGATAAMGVLTWSVPGLWAALVVLLLGVHRREPLLCGQGMAAFVFFLSRYYYSLEVTLLVKSAALVMSGALLLAVWRLLPPAPRTEVAT